MTQQIYWVHIKDAVKPNHFQGEFIKASSWQVAKLIAARQFKVSLDRITVDKMPVLLDSLEALGKEG